MLYADEQKEYLPLMILRTPPSWSHYSWADHMIYTGYLPEGSGGTVCPAAAGSNPKTDTAISDCYGAIGDVNCYLQTNSAFVSEKGFRKLPLSESAAAEEVLLHFLPGRQL